MEKMLINAKELAQFIGTHPSTISKLLKENPEVLPPPVRNPIGKTPRWFIEDVREFYKSAG